MKIIKDLPGILFYWIYLKKIHLTYKATLIENDALLSPYSPWVENISMKASHTCLLCLSLSLFPFFFFSPPSTGGGGGVRRGRSFHSALTARLKETGWEIGCRVEGEAWMHIYMIFYFTCIPKEELINLAFAHLIHIPFILISYDI